MPHTIPTTDSRDKPASAPNGYEAQRFLADVHSKLAEAEAEIRDRKVSDAREGLRDLRRKYGLSAPANGSFSTCP